MIIVLAYDGLEINKVNEYDNKNLKLDHYGKTDISEFPQTRTMILWSSFLTGENKHDAIMAIGNEQMWDKKWDAGETFLGKFGKVITLDMPGYSYDKDFHDRSRGMLKAFFETEDKEEKERIRSEYNKDSFAHHRIMKEKFWKAIDEKPDVLIGYFHIADVIGHLNFGNNTMMKMIYQDLDEIAEKVRSMGKLLIVSDHGMEAIGMFGDHTGYKYAYWSTNFKDLGNPKITDFKGIFEELVSE